MIILKLEHTDISKHTANWRQKETVLESKRKEIVITVGKDMQKKLRAAAPKDTGLFAEGIKAQSSFDPHFGQSTVHVESTGEHAQLTKGTMFNPGGLMLHTILRTGTKAHRIPTGGAAAQIAKGYPLRFYWANGPKGPGIYRYWSVWHPGTKPNPFVAETVDENMPRYRDMLRALGVEVLRTGRSTLS